MTWGALKVWDIDQIGRAIKFMTFQIRHFQIHFLVQIKLHEFQCTHLGRPPWPMTLSNNLFAAQSSFIRPFANILGPFNHLQPFRTSKTPQKIVKSSIHMYMYIYIYILYYIYIILYIYYIIYYILYVIYYILYIYVMFISILGGFSQNNAAKLQFWMSW